jgi:hypothetical protein
MPAPRPTPRALVVSLAAAGALGVGVLLRVIEFVMLALVASDRKVELSTERDVEDSKLTIGKGVFEVLNA